MDLAGGRAGPVFRRHCHRNGLLAARPGSLPGSRRHHVLHILSGARGGRSVPDQGRRGTRALDPTVIGRDDFRGRFRRVLLVPGDPSRDAARRDRLPQAGPESGVPRARLCRVAHIGGAGPHRRRQRRRLARAAAVAERICHHVSRRHSLVARQGARLLPAGWLSGRPVPVLQRAGGRRRARSDAYHCGAGARHVEYLGRSGALSALCGDAGRLSRTGVFRPRRYRRPVDRDDHDRVHAHAAVHGPAGCDVARGCTAARAPGGAHGRGAIRLASGTVGPVELRIERGARRCVLEGVGSNLTQDPAVQGLALNFRDISERKALEEQLRKLAFHDPLTLLANRNLFRDRVQHALTLAQCGQSSVAVMFLDLDNFKNINDSLGHDAGDCLLQAVAQRIVKTTRSSDTVARLGGDEFAVLLEGIASVTEVGRLADALIDTLDLPFTLDGVEVRVAASLGVAFSTPDTDAEALLSNADIAMYHAKAAGKNRHVTFQPQMQDMLQERLRLEADIGRALAHQEFFLEYQPIIDLGTKSLLGVEALVRWRHPEAGILLPGRFIQVAEECGQIVKLGRWVLQQACRDVCAWRTSIAGGNGLRLAVNISGRHLQHGELVDDVAQALRESGFEAGNLVIELTESTTMYNTDANLERFQRLKALGVKLAIDDFGTGYSSLSYLHRFPIDILK
ncbi:MAG: EAL domain-containing protein, partial [Gammaproteobacteria bacterium]